MSEIWYRVPGIGRPIADTWYPIPYFGPMTFNKMGTLPLPLALHLATYTVIGLFCAFAGGLNLIDPTKIIPNALIFLGLAGFRWPARKCWRWGLSRVSGTWLPGSGSSARIGPSERCCSPSAPMGWPHSRSIAVGSWQL